MKNYLKIVVPDEPDCVVFGFETFFALFSGPCNTQNMVININKTAQIILQKILNFQQNVSKMSDWLWWLTGNKSQSLPCIFNYLTKCCISTEITTLILCRFALRWKQVKAMTTERMPTHHRLWALYIRLRIHMWHFHLVIFSFEVVPLSPNDGLCLLLLTFLQLLLQPIDLPPALGDLHSGLQQHFAEYFNDLWGCRHHEPLNQDPELSR